MTDDRTLRPADDEALLLPTLWRRRRLIATAALAGALVAGAGSLLLPTRYTSTGTLLVTSTEQGDGTTAVMLTIDEPERYLQNLATDMLSDDVLAEVLDEVRQEIDEPVDGRAIDELRERFSVTPRPDADLLVVTAEAARPEVARQLAASLVDAYEQRTATQVSRRAREMAEQLRAAQGQAADRLVEIEAELADSSSTALTAEQSSVLEQLTTLREREEQLAVSVALLGSGLQTVENPDLPEAASQPAPLLATALGGTLTAAATGAGVFALATSGTGSVPSALAARLAVPVIGTVPPRRRRQSTLERVGAIADSVVAGTALLTCPPISDRGPCLVAVASAGGSTVRAQTAAALAARFAGEGTRVVLVDADVDGAALLTELLASAGQPGLREAARDADGSVALAAATAPAALGGARFVPVGGSGGPLPPSTDRLRSLLSEIGKDDEVVIVDAAALTAGAAGPLVAGASDGVLLVTDEATDPLAAGPLLQRLTLVPSRVLGIVAAPERRALAGPFGWSRRRGR